MVDCRKARRSKRNEKKTFLLLAFAITGLALNGCSGGGTTDVDTSQTESVAESESSEVEPTSTVEMPDGFTKITQEQAESCRMGMERSKLWKRLYSRLE